MSIRLRVGLAIAALALLPTVAAADISPACKQAIGVGGAKFVKKVLKLGQRCAMRKGANARTLRAPAPASSTCAPGPG